MSRGMDRIEADIAKYGWHVIKVMEDDEGPGFAYSIGLHRSFGHPEVIVFGLPLDLMHRMVNTIGAEVRRGERFAAGSRSDAVLVGRPVEFRSVAAGWLDEFFGQAIRYHGGPACAALQCCWPDRAGRFPGQAGVEAGCRAAQPDLQANPG